MEPARSNLHGADALFQGREVDTAAGARSDEGEEGRRLADEQCRLFQGGEVAATAFGFVPVDDVAEALLGPAPRGSLKLVGEHAAAGRRVDVVTFVEWSVEPAGDGVQALPVQL